MKSAGTPHQPVSIDKNQVFELTKRLDAIIRLIASSLPQDMTQQTKIELLSESGFQPKEIAGVLGTTPGTVNNALQRLKKKAGKKDEQTQRPEVNPSQGVDTE